tara:strand:- start:1582 stop:2979 length:1398 start_codon:yes stop_codon:yes gene_type:complete
MIGLNIFVFFFLILIILLCFTFYLHKIFFELKWDWSKISLQKIKFPQNFIWGTATAAHQIEGNCTNNWSEFEKGYKENNEPNIKDRQKSGLACDSWNRYKEDINLIKEIGVSHYRFSIEWSKIQPNENEINHIAINHYHKMINSLIENNITPVITLYHFTHPIWFDRKGAFEKKTNIQYFVKFCKIVFNEFSSKVSLWCTINEPAVMTSMGYFSGEFPPGKKDSQLCAVVLSNLLNAHVEVYHSLKILKNGKNVQIGIVKNINHFDPWKRWNILDWVVTWAVNKFFNYSTLEFFRTGNFNVKLPGLMWYSDMNELAINANDFIGLNYYSHNYLKFNWSFKEPFIVKYKVDDIMTDMPYSIYGEGLYRAIQDISILNLPIFITENGIADAKDDRRELFIKRYLYSVSEAIKDGYDVRGYFYWSLLDNFEWAFGYDMKFGLYKVDFKTQERKLRKGSQPFKKIITMN